jgi:hypothetical protein
MNPIRVTAPADPVVSVFELREHLRISGNDSDMQLQTLERAAVAHLDGWRGVLGRCILPQTWRVFLPAGTIHLPFPDVTAVEGAEWSPDYRYVTMAAAGPVEFTCALPEDALDAVKDAIRIWVQMRYDGLSGPERDAYQDAFNSLISPLRWIGV